MFTVSIEGRNLTDEYLHVDDGTAGHAGSGFETWGRSLLLGVTAKF